MADDIKTRDGRMFPDEETHDPTQPPATPDPRGGHDYTKQDGPKSEAHHPDFPRHWQDDRAWSNPETANPNLEQHVNVDDGTPVEKHD